MWDDLWVDYAAPAVFGLLIGSVALLIFVRLSTLVGYKKGLSFFVWLVGNGGIIVGAITYLERVIAREAAIAQDSSAVYAHFTRFVVSYLGGYGVGGLLTLNPFFRRMTIDQAFVDIFLPLRKEMSDQEVMALKLFLGPKEPSLVRKITSWFTHRPPDNPGRPVDLNVAAAAMGVSREDYNRYLKDGMRKLTEHLKPPLQGGPVP